MTVAQVRVTVTGDGPWQVAVAGLGLDEPARHTMAVIADGKRRYPAPADGSGDAAAFTRTLVALRKGEAADADARALGQHLFASLCAPAWSAVERWLGATPPDLLELALDLDGAPSLHGLPWELMACPSSGWLAQAVTVGGAMVDVAITRRTRGGVATTPPLAHPLRYLFVIGTGIDDAVRAGAECLGLLRQIAPAVQERIVERQSLEQIAAVVAEFDPHIVHVICHGRDVEGGGVELELWNKERNEPGFVPGAGLTDALVRHRADARVRTRRAPAMVILSACSSGDRTLAPGDGGVARALIAAGVPVVLAMAAEIGDQACRLFTRGLGTALVDRTPLLAAVSRGRRVALRTRTSHGCDWGQIQLVLDAKVEPDLAVAARTDSSDEARVMRWLEAAALPIDLTSERSYPPLCGGTSLFDTFYRVFAEGRSVLALVARPPKEGVRVGKRRAIAELAATAIRAGHVPVLVLPGLNTGYPRKLRDLVERLADGVRAAWDRHELGTPPPLALDALATELAAPAARVDLWTPLDSDCAALRDRARAAHALIKDNAGEVVIFLHDLHAYGDAVSPVLALIRARGKSLRRAATFVISWKMTPPKARDTTRSAFDQELTGLLADGLTWIKKLELAPLAPIDAMRADYGLETIPMAAQLALQRILLEPYRSEPEHVARRWWLDLRAGHVDQKAIRDLVISTRGCCLGEFDDEYFVVGLGRVLEDRKLPFADDDLVMKGGRPR